jgi:hypothetical protein
MSEMKHTPGPWQWDAGVIPPDGPGRYADIYVTGEDGEPLIIAEFNDSIPQGRANACLIAAAPDLLDACNRAEWWLSTHPEGTAMRDVLRVAIAKAEGREP